MDNQHLKKLSYLGAVGTVENLVKRLRHRQRQNDLLVYISSLGEMFPPRFSPSPLVYYFVCFAPFTEEDGGRAVDSHDRWQSVCVCMLLCFFLLLYSSEESQPGTINTAALSYHHI